LLAASRYPNHAQPLWNLPGGRQRNDELLGAALAREFREETGLEIAVEGLLYVSESHDRATATHFLNVTFAVTAAADAEPQLPKADAHVVALEWVERNRVAARLPTRAVREPLTAYLRGEARRYFGFVDAGITIVFADPD